MKLPILLQSAALVTALIGLASPALATTLQLASPAPKHADERRATFESRLQPDSPYLKEVADRFFSYLHPEVTLEMTYGDEALRDTFNRAIALYHEGRYLAALEAYRDGFMDRLAEPNGPMPQRPRLMMSRTSAEDAITEANRMLQDPLVFINPVVTQAVPDGMEWRDFVQETRDRVESLHLALGTPGSINWTWTPENITPVNSWNPERWVERDLGDVTQGFALLRAYLETGEDRYLHRYADIHDDRHMNWLRDVLDSGRGLYIGVNDSEGYSDEIGLDASLFGALRHLAIHRPESRRAFPALTLAQSLLRMYEVYLPVQMRLVRCITGNRLSHMYSQRLLSMGIAFPEFVFSDYLVREKRRAFEAYPVVSGYPDGHDVNWAYNYAFNYTGGTGTFALLPHDPAAPSYHSPEWTQLQRDFMVRRIRTLAHSLFINGTAPRWARPDQDYSVRWRHVARQEENRMFPIWMTDHPDIQRIAGTVYADGWAGVPYATSDAFPYTGFYHLRSGWNPTEDVDVFFSPYRTFHYWGPSLWGHLKFFAYGRTFIEHRHGGELLADGAPKVEAETAHLLPEHYLDVRTPSYGLPQWHMGDDRILPYRFLTSSAFDFAEGTYAAPFIDAESRRVFEDIIQERQIFLVKKSGLLIVSDRIQSDAERLYSLQWGLHASVSPDDLAYDEETGIVHTRTPKASNLSILQTSTAESLFAGGQSSGESLERLEEINWRGRFGQDIRTHSLSYHYGPTRAARVITVLHARRPGEEPLREFAAITDDTTIGFDAVTKEGEKIAFRQSISGSVQSLQAGSAVANAITLLSAGDDRLVLGAATAADSTYPADYALLQGENGEDPTLLAIHRPIPLPSFAPDATAFADVIDVELHHPSSDVSILYTLDGSDPTRESPRYTEPIRLDATTLLKAVAVRKDYTGEIGWQADSTDYSITAPALFRKVPMQPALEITTSTLPGLRYQLFKGDLRLTGINFPMAGTLLREGIADSPHDLPGKPEDPAANYGVRFNGYLTVPESGTYIFWIPEPFMHWAVDSGCDLKLWIGGRLWDPATQRHGLRGWSIPLEAGSHTIQIDFIDMRPGDLRPGETTGRVYWFDREQEVIGDRLMWEHRIWDGTMPVIDITAPTLPRQPLPAAWLTHN